MRYAAGDLVAQQSKDGEEKAASKNPVMQSAEPANLIVVADTDLLSDSSWLQYQNFFGRQVAVLAGWRAPDRPVNVADSAAHQANRRAPIRPRLWLTTTDPTCARRTAR